VLRWQARGDARGRRRERAGAAAAACWCQPPSPCPWPRRGERDPRGEREERKRRRIWNVKQKPAYIFVCLDYDEKLEKPFRS